MNRTLIDTDDALLEQARGTVGTTTNRATVSAARRQVVALQARGEFLAGARRGDLTDAADPTVVGCFSRRAGYSSCVITPSPPSASTRA